MCSNLRQKGLFAIISNGLTISTRPRLFCLGDADSKNNTPLKKKWKPMTTHMLRAEHTREDEELGTGANYPGLPLDGWLNQVGEDIHRQENTLSGSVCNKNSHVISRAMSHKTRATLIVQHNANHMCPSLTLAGNHTRPASVCTGAGGIHELRLLLYENYPRERVA